MNAGINKYGYGDEAEKSPIPVAKPKAEPMKGVVSFALPSFCSVIRHFGHSRTVSLPSTVLRAAIGDEDEDKDNDDACKGDSASKRCCNTVVSHYKVTTILECSATSVSLKFLLCVDVVSRDDWASLFLAHQLFDFYSHAAFFLSSTNRWVPLVSPFKRCAVV